MLVPVPTSLASALSRKNPQEAVDAAYRRQIALAGVFLQPAAESHFDGRRLQV
jgi:hypothetical protein